MSASTSRSTKLSFTGVTSTSAQRCARRDNGVSAPGQSSTAASWSRASAARRSGSGSPAAARNASWRGRGTASSFAFAQASRLAKKRVVVRCRESRSRLATRLDRPRPSNPTTRCAATVDLPEPPFSFPTTIVRMAAPEAARPSPVYHAGAAPGCAIVSPASRRETMPNEWRDGGSARPRTERLAPPLNAGGPTPDASPRAASMQHSTRPSTRHPRRLALPRPIRHRAIRRPCPPSQGGPAPGPGAAPPHTTSIEPARISTLRASLVVR